jgi:hypothetical protein
VCGCERPTLQETNVDDIILTGRNPKADAKLIADVLNAPPQLVVVECDDPYDGGCPADIMPRRRHDIIDHNETK